MPPDDNPWSNVPAADYEAHMNAVGPSAVLREIFERVVADVRPRRVAVLGNGDAVDAKLNDGPYDLVHVALLLEHVDPLPLFRRIAECLGPSGTLSTIAQEPSAGQIAALAQAAGFALASRRTVKLPTGKTLVSSIFDKVRKPLDRRRGRTRC